MEASTQNRSAEPQSKKPSNSRFKQQKLGAWQPIITAKTASPVFLVLGLLFVGVGVGILHFSNKVQEIKIDYTECKSIKNPDGNCDQEINKWNEREQVASKDGIAATESCLCEIPFTLEEEFKGEVLIYYALTNFYQNHRRYIRSRDDKHLLGEDLDRESGPAEDCGPGHRTVNINGKTKWYWPCGVIANSMFTDEIELHAVPNKSVSNNTIPVKLIRTGIAWESDKKNKFQNPNNGWNNETFDKDPQFVKPKSWLKNPFELDPENPDNNGVKNEDFIIWMRTAALSNFRKLYRKVSREQEYEDGMPAGSYVWKIKYSYPVKSFKGTKSVILSTTSLLGSKNAFLGIAYIVVGSLGVFLGIIFIFLQIKYGKSQWDISHED